MAPFLFLCQHALTSVDLFVWWQHKVVLKSVGYSLAAGLASAIVAGLLGWTLAYQVCFRDFPGRRLIERLVVLPLLLPSFVTAAIYRDLFATSGLLARSFGLPGILTIDFESLGGFIFVLSISLFPYVYLLCRVAFLSHGTAFFELGQSLGLGFRQSFATILRPMALPALLLGCSLVFIETAGDWPTTTLLSLPSAGSEVHQLWFSRSQPNLSTQLALLLVLLALLLAIPLVRRIQRSRPHYLALVAQKPGRLLQVHSSRDSWLWFRPLLCLVPALLGFFIPVLAVLYHFANTIHVIDLSSLAVSCLHTVLLLLAVVLICLPFALLFGLLAQGGAGRVVVYIGSWFTLSYLIPATVLAVSVLLVLEVTPFERYGDGGSFAVLATTLAVRFVGFLLIPLQLGLWFLSKQVDETGVSLGVTSQRRYLRLQLPQLRGFLLLGLMLLLLLVLQETTISVVLHPFSLQTLALKTYAYINIDLVPESSAWILATILLGTYPLLTIESMLSSRTRRDRSPG